jgi:hypothetical protein
MRRLVLVPLVAVVILGACGTGELPQLPLSAGGAAKQDSALAGGMMPVRPVRYELADGVTINVDHANAYRYPTATIDDARRVARALGVDDNASDLGEGGGWSFGKAPRLIFMGRSGGFALTDSSAVSSGVACAQVSGPDQPPQPCPTTTTTQNANLPSDDKAKTFALATMKAAGADTTHSTATVEHQDQFVVVEMHTTVGDKGASDDHFSSMSIGAGNEILGAAGQIGSPELVGSYELATLQRAVDRLNEAAANPGPVPMGAAEPALAPVDQAPRVIQLTGVSMGLTNISDSDHLWDVPAYVFTMEDGNTVTSPAAADKYFPTTATTIGDTPPTGGGETKPPASDEVPPSQGSGGGSVEPASPSPTTIPRCVSTTDPIPAEVCADPTSIKAGGSVHFTITASDPDRAFQDNCTSDGVSAEYGDDSGGDVHCAMCTTTVPDGPGKISRTRDHTYTKPGNYAAKFTISSGPVCGPRDPRDSTAVLTIAINVN